MYVFILFFLDWTPETRDLYAKVIWPMLKERGKVLRMHALKKIIKVPSRILNPHKHKVKKQNER